MGLPLLKVHSSAPPPAGRSPRFRRCLMIAGLVLLVAGCQTGYRLTLSNGTIITSTNKPKFDPKESVYRFKDAHGQEHALPGFRVQSIDPL
jgi:Bacterial protein of unknown function (DUF903)